MAELMALAATVLGVHSVKQIILEYRHA